MMMMIIIIIQYVASFCLIFNHTPNVQQFSSFIVFAALFFILSFLSSYCSYEHQIWKLHKRLRVKISKSAELHSPFF